MLRAIPRTTFDYYGTNDEDVKRHNFIHSQSPCRGCKRLLVCSLCDGMRACQCTQKETYEDITVGSPWLTARRQLVATSR